MSALTPLPTAPSTSDPSTFNARADAFIAALPGLITELNAIIGLTIPAGSAAAGTLTGDTVAANVLYSSLQKLGVQAQNLAMGGFKATGLAVGSAATDSATYGQVKPAFKNRLINPAFQIDRRNGGASTAVADDAYSFDRVNILTQTAAVNVSQLTDPENGYTHGIRLTQNQASAQRMGFSQLIEGKNCKDLRGQSVAFGGRIRCSSSQAIRYAILEWTGTEDSPTSDVVNDWTSATYTTGNFFIATTTTVVAVGSITPSANVWTALTALTGTISSSLNNLTLLVWTEGTAAQNVTLDCDIWQLEQGSTVSDFERRPITVEEALCDRYLPNYTPRDAGSLYVGSGYQSTTSLAYILFAHKVRARKVPTGITVQAAGAFSELSSGTAAASITAVGPGLDFTLLTFNNAALMVGNKQATHMLSTGVTGNFYLTGCEL